MIMVYSFLHLKNVFILLSFFEGYFAKYKVLGWLVFCITMLRTLFYCLLISTVSNEKPAVMDIIALLPDCNVSVFSEYFQDFSLLLVFIDSHGSSYLSWHSLNFSDLKICLSLNLGKFWPPQKDCFLSYVLYFWV